MTTDNYANPAAIYFISIFFPILGSTAVALRFYTRRQKKTLLWYDDWLILPALGLEFAMAALLLWATAKGSMGRHLPPPSVPGPAGYLSSTSPQQVRLSQTQYYLDWIAAFQFGFVKLSILFFYQRIFANSLVGRNAMGIATNIAIILTVIWTLAFGIAAILRCGSTPHYIWTSLISAGQHCGGHLYLLHILKASTISDFIMDILIWCLPVPKICATSYLDHL
ncbi:hypothetical protein EAF04_008279 [Stromatinia cepivora]|nr:hypothetical protein EAF04_008279 [Stromatinia cepivora]